jgi:hypothetical protein
MVTIVEQLVEWMSGRRNRRARRKTCPNAALSTTDHTLLKPRSNPGRRGWSKCTSLTSLNTHLTVWDYPEAGHEHKHWHLPASSGTTACARFKMASTNDRYNLPNNDQGICLDGSDFVTYVSLIFQFLPFYPHDEPNTRARVWKGEGGNF